MGAKIEIKGNLGNDPQLLYTKTGEPYLTFSVYQPHTVKKEENGQVKFIDMGGFWMDCVWFDKKAQTAVKNLSKGSPIMLIGDLRKEQWKDADTNETRQKFKVVVKTLGMTFRFPSDADAQEGLIDEDNAPQSGVTPDGDIDNRIPF